MVLVDPSFAEQSAETSAVSPAEKEFFDKSVAQSRERLSRCESLAAQGSITPSNPQGCFTVRASEPEADGEEKLRQGVRPEYYRALRSELEGVVGSVGYDKITNAARATAHPLGNLPLIVLTSSKPFQQGGPSAADDAAVTAVWKHGHDRLAAYSSRGLSEVVPDSSHMIQEDQPQDVADAIKAIIQDCCRAR
jgi:pimeloyl-ACP methyl ester carboxylesterase